MEKCWTLLGELTIKNKDKVSSLERSRKTNKNYNDVREYWACISMTEIREPEENS
jgi:hypothetical protein